MKVGVIRKSLKENEQRVPIYPEHIPWIDSSTKNDLIFENDYGIDFNYSNDYFLNNKIRMSSRDEIFRECDVIILPKPVIGDLEQMKEHQVLWGWPHCVQQIDVAQCAIERKLTLIAWEAMHHWGFAGEKLMHIFYKNNEVAGYSAVLHTLQILGSDGHYGPRRHVVVIGYGSVSRGAIYALQGRGFNNIHVYTRRPTHLVADQNPDVYFHHLRIEKDGTLYSEYSDGTSRIFLDVLSEADIVINGVLQDTDNPMMYFGENKANRLKPRSVIIDISCDKGMGFPFACPTTFDNPVFTVGNNVIYYSIDHTPTYLWNAASREISKALLPYLKIIRGGPSLWYENETISKAIEIRDGVVINKKILSFQKRKHDYPHDRT